MDYDVVAIKSNVRMHGIFLKEGEAVGIVDTESGAKQLDLKDGGAHVDTKLTMEYAALQQDGAVGSFGYFRKGQPEEYPIQNAHLVSLRQMGYELLHSPQLTALCDT